MIEQAITLIGERLADPTKGTNACLAELVLAKGWTAADAPDLVQVLWETEHLAAALRQVPGIPNGGDPDEVYPCQLVGMGTPSDQDAHVKAATIRDGQVELIVRDVDRNATAAQGTRGALRRLQAAQLSIERLFLDEPEAARLLDGVYLWHKLSSQIVPVWDVVGDTLCTCALKLVFKVRDTAAY